MKKNISMDVFMKEEVEEDFLLLNEFEPRPEDFVETSSMKDLMRKVKEDGVGGKKEHIQTTLDSFLVRSKEGITLEDAEIRIQSLECENAVLRNEVQEMREKMNRLESLFFHSPPMIEPVSIDSVSQSLLYDKMSTKMRELEKEVSNIKITVESFDATQNDHEDRIEWLESHYEEDDSRVGEDGYPDLGF